MKQTKALYIVVITVASLVIGVLLARAIIVRCGMMPYEEDMAIRWLLGVFGVKYPAPEDIQDVGLYSIVLACWAGVAAVLVLVSKFAKRTHSRRKSIKK
ncbi:hypothetical protein [Caballeronia sp. GAFFF1]|uniref:hypothetical protein n=1 Tax=Caballeronia sp. GAFFF1 TaxID=2921779 RepID=UPI002027F8AC|nr:hypothetical protein [Caballeronia sp. GAFFF1]